MFFCSFVLDTCDKKWKLVEESCYLVVHESMTWFGAYAHCRRLRSELYTDDVHLPGFVMDGRSFWTGLAIGWRLDRGLQWQWSNGTTFQWKYRQIQVRHLGCSGCSYMRNRTLYLTSHCHENLLFFCQGELPGIQTRSYTGACRNHFVSNRGEFLQTFQLTNHRNLVYKFPTISNHFTY